MNILNAVWKQTKTVLMLGRIIVGMFLGTLLSVLFTVGEVVLALMLLFGASAAADYIERQAHAGQFAFTSSVNTNAAITTAILAVLLAFGTLNLIRRMRPRVVPIPIPMRPVIVYVMSSEEEEPSSDEGDAPSD